MSPVSFIDGMWHVRAPAWIARIAKQDWTPLLIGSGYTETDALARAERLGLVVTAGRPKIRRVK